MAMIPSPNLRSDIKKMGKTVRKPFSIRPKRNEIIRHWRILLRISTLNAGTRGFPLGSPREGLNLLKENTEYSTLISA
jgi:hypothetical protein